MVPAQFPSKTSEPHSHSINIRIFFVFFTLAHYTLIYLLSDYLLTYCFVGEYTCEVDVESPIESCLIYSG